MNIDRTTYLYRQYQRKALTESEQQEWDLLLASPDLDEALKGITYQDWDSLSEDAFLEMKSSRSAEILSGIMDRPQERVRSRRLWPRIAVAAAVATVIFGAGLFYYTNQNLKSDPAAALVVRDVAPGKVGATLTLASGKKIKLSDAGTGELAKEAGVIIKKTADGQIVYEIKASENAASNKTNTLSTARGETYKVQLPDGSMVWLNAASSLIYPATFVGKEQRRVSLTGEGYFEIAKDKAHPFIVTSEQQDVEVLGTHFNINTYQHSKEIKTTLLEGSVRLYYYPKNRTAEIEKILKPGQQSTIKNNDISVAEVDTDDAIAWKNGFFVFDEETLENVMDKVGRWYDLEIEYQSPALKQEIFGGSVSRTENVSQVLSVLTKAGTVKFKLSGRKIIVTK
jgi:ferric-dicitrate binding protein FerR (iron transport regulator)